MRFYSAGRAIPDKYKLKLVLISETSLALLVVMHGCHYAQLRIRRIIIVLRRICAGARGLLRNPFATVQYFDEVAFHP
jgi:hypothetical protein